MTTHPLAFTGPALVMPFRLQGVPGSPGLEEEHEAML